MAEIMNKKKPTGIGRFKRVVSKVMPNSLSNQLANMLETSLNNKAEQDKID